MHAVVCPNCREPVKVPAGHHVVSQTQTASGRTAGIAIDGKAVHRCDNAARAKTR
jgi:hypothetical protein